MSVDGTKLLFEGFLQKRKDTMKIRWVTYWFRLQNTTLFFYTRKNDSALHLRSYYYIYTVQSVREVQRPDSSRRFMFEITMKNGKRKMLAAETAALRREWVHQLWEAIHLSFCRSSDSGDTNLDECEQRDRRNSSSTHLCTHGNTGMESLPAGLISAPSPSVQIHCETSGVVASPTNLPLELDSKGPMYQSTPSVCNYQCRILS
ncbi:uncharacterized protein LOC131475258 [Solea solea]|uniref:uncharacterized protein LOC131475258 n=1 Tax=Solea solea TaxID=90069 RepID=UPI00272A90EB|nr:uncharacterized protein LOC131475258 [Solea solea]